MTAKSRITGNDETGEYGFHCLACGLTIGGLQTVEEAMAYMKHQCDDKATPRHWSEKPELASRTRAVFDSIAPRDWDVYVWTQSRDGREQSNVSGRLDAANAHGLIARILEASETL